MNEPPPSVKPTPSGEQVALIDAIREIVPHVRGADPAAPREAERHLEEVLPRRGPVLVRIERLARRGVAEGWLLPRTGGPHVRYGRLAKDVGGYSVDFVLMEGAAAGHTHPQGEINFGWAWSGDPTFDGRPPGWVVFPPASHHVPTVTGGEMLLLYFLPGGKVAWDPPSAPKA